MPSPCAESHSLISSSVNDLAHEGTSIFLSNIKGNEDLYEQVQNVLNLLYTSESIRPGTRSVTFILRDMAGIAFTCGTPLDPDHKEIHLSVRHIAHASEEKNVRGEILGVVCPFPLPSVLRALTRRGALC